MPTLGADSGTSSLEASANDLTGVARVIQLFAMRLNLMEGITPSQPG
jgi:hypothetical protein